MPGELKRRNIVNDFNCSLKLNPEGDKNITKMSCEKVVSDHIQAIDIRTMEKDVESQNHNSSNVEEAAEIVTLPANVKEKLSKTDIGDIQSISPENIKSGTTGEKVIRAIAVKIDNTVGTSNTKISNVVMSECSPQLSLDCDKMNSDAIVNKHFNNLNSDGVIHFDNDIENTTREENYVISKSVSSIVLQDEHNKCQKIILLEKSPVVVNFAELSETGKSIGDMRMTDDEFNVSISTKNYSNRNVFNEVVTEKDYVGNNHTQQSTLIHIWGRI